MRRKNTKFIDPRYFMDEKMELREGFGGRVTQTITDPQGQMTGHDAARRVMNVAFGERVGNDDGYQTAIVASGLVVALRSPTRRAEWIVMWSVNDEIGRVSSRGSGTGGTSRVNVTKVHKDSVPGVDDQADPMEDIQQEAEQSKANGSEFFFGAWHTTMEEGTGKFIGVNVRPKELE